MSKIRAQPIKYTKQPNHIENIPQSLLRYLREYHAYEEDQVVYVDLDILKEWQQDRISDVERKPESQKAPIQERRAIWELKCLIRENKGCLELLTGPE